MIEYVVIGVALLIIAWAYHLMKSSGFLSEIEPIVTEKPKNLSESLTVYYKYHVGAYSGVSSILSEVKALVPQLGAKTFGIFYDNPEFVPSHLLQSAVGIVVSEGAKDLYYDEKLYEELVENGFEKMVLPKVERAVQAVQPSTGGILSFLALVHRTYGIVKDFIAANRLETKYAVEFYADNEISVEFPLEHIEEFLVPDYTPTDQLEAKLARKKFDSDEEDSESEPEREDAEEEEEEGGNAEEEEEKEQK